jgi:cyanophycin synthetase
VGVNLARFKQLGAQVLRQAGLPVTEPRRVVDASQAIEQARAIGYPVVIKPGNLDGGLGVSAGLQDAQAVRSAFEAARKLSTMILIEKHIDGRDYRLTVMDGEVLWAIERVPGGVTGDGERTVSALVDALNADPRRGVGAHAHLKRLVLDDQALGLLAQRGMDAQSVPPPGLFVPLRTVANIRMGGHAVAVKDAVHPDNAHLAVRAAQALRLDLAGIDLLMPDIRRSWLETGAAICEVNAQPDLGATTGAHLYGEIMDKLLPDGGRIPIVLVLGAPPMADLIRDLTRHLGRLGLRAGWMGERGLIADDQVLTNGIPSLYEAGQMLVRDPSVDVIVLPVADDGFLRTGLPFDRFDVLVLGGFDLPHDPKGDTGAEPPLHQSLLEALLPSCTGTVILVNRQWMAHLGTLRTPAHILQNDIPPERITCAVVEALGYPSELPAPVPPDPRI